jgi:hypothetical protein
MDALLTSCVVWTRDLNSTTHPLTMLKKAVASWGSPGVEKGCRGGVRGRKERNEGEGVEEMKEREEGEGKR